MAVFEIEKDGKVFEVDAPHMGAAVAALKSEAKQVGGLGAFLEGVKSGVTMNFSDELSGVAAASGLPNWVPDSLRVAGGVGRAAADAFMGRDDARKAYEARRDEVRADQKLAQEQHPLLNIAGNVAGAVAIPMGGALNAATLPGRIGRGALAGAGFGGVSGLGDGETTGDRLAKGAGGAAMGAVVGAAAPPIVEGAIQGIRSVSAPITNAVRGAINPEAEASRRVATALERDIRNDPNAVTRLDPNEFVAARSDGQPVSVMDLGGNLTRRLADSANITSPEGGEQLNRAINQRFEGQGDRITNWLRGAFNFPDATAQRSAIDTVERTVNRANYARAHMNPSANALWDEGFEQLMQAPLMQQAAREATTTGANRSALQGFTPPRRPFEFQDADSLMPRYSLRQDENGNRVLPNLEFWDHVQRNLRDKTETLRRQGANAAASDAQQLRTSLLNRLDTLVPEFNTARTGAAKFFGAENALEAGENFVGASQRYGIPETRAILAKMSQPERQLFQDGYVFRFIEMVEKTGDRRNVLNQIAQSKAAQQELQMALGPRWRELETRLRVEEIMDLPRSAVQGNSWTARRLHDLGLAGGAGLGAMGTYDLDPAKMTAGALVAALSSGGRRVDQNVARRVAEMLISSDPNVLNRGIQTIARSNNLLNALRSYGQTLPRVGGQQSYGAMPGVQGPSRVAAEDEQK